MNSEDYQDPIINSVFAYDEASPSCLVFNVNVMGGKNNKQVIKHKGDVAGSKEYNHKSGTPMSWRVQYDGKRYNVHRLIWLLHYGEIPDGMIVDHLDGNPFNNKIENLQAKTVRANNQNLKLNSRNKSGICGVFLEKTKHGDIAWTSTWYDVDKKSQRKRFYFSDENEKELKFYEAVEFRKNKIQQLKELNMSYTDRHGR